MNRRLETALRIIKLFEGQPQVASVFLRGSLATGEPDEYSDIDIGIDVSGNNNADFAASVGKRMKDEFDLYFSDWAPSLMPQKYVQSFYIKGLPIFWNIDIEVSATPHYPTLTSRDITRNQIAGFLKVWVLNTKYLIRRKPGIEEQITAYFSRVFKSPPPSKEPPDSLLHTVLGELERGDDGQFGEFISCCYEICDRFHFRP